MFPLGYSLSISCPFLPSDPAESTGLPQLPHLPGRPSGPHSAEDLRSRAEYPEMGICSGESTSTKHYNFCSEASELSTASAIGDILHSRWKEHSKSSIRLPWRTAAPCPDGASRCPPPCSGALWPPPYPCSHLNPQPEADKYIEEGLCIAGG